jgi:hypothetical protein
MKITEKFYPYCDNEYQEKWIAAENCEDIADEYAIQFADWLIKNQIYYFQSLKELLKEFKKQNEL